MFTPHQQWSIPSRLLIRGLLGSVNEPLGSVHAYKRAWVQMKSSWRYTTGRAVPMQAPGVGMWVNSRGHEWAMVCVKRRNGKRNNEQKAIWKYVRVYEHEWMMYSVRAFKVRLQTSRTLCCVTKHARRTPAAASVRAVAVAAWVKAYPMWKWWGTGCKCKAGGRSSLSWQSAAVQMLAAGVGDEQGVARGVSCGMVSRVMSHDWATGGWALVVVWLDSRSGWVRSRGRRCA